MFDAVEQVVQIKEVAAIYEINDTQGETLEAAIEGLENDIYIDTASLEHIKRWEKMLGISSLDTDSLADRRPRVKAKVNECLPYTIRVLRKKLDIICGEDGYVLELDRSNKKMVVTIALTRKAEIETIKAIVDEMTPLNYVFGIELMYNTWEDIAKMTWGEASAYTWKQIKEKVI